MAIETQRRIEHGLKEPKISTLERLSVLYKVDLVKLALKQRHRASSFSEESAAHIKAIIWHSCGNTTKLVFFMMLVQV